MLEKLPTWEWSVCWPLSVNLTQSRVTKEREGHSSQLTVSSIGFGCEYACINGWRGKALGVMPPLAGTLGFFEKASWENHGEAVSNTLGVCASAPASKFLTWVLVLAPADAGLYSAGWSKAVPPQVGFGHGVYHNSKQTNTVALKWHVCIWNV